MIKLASEADQVCVAKATEAGQKHLFDDWDTLGQEAQRRLIRQLESLDFQVVARLLHHHFRDRADCPGDLDPSPLRAPALPAACAPEAAEYREIGEEALAKGKVGLVVASGGHGNFSEPVGFQPIGPVSGKPIFRLLAERVRATNRRHKTSLRWWIVTHPRTHEQTVEHFRSQNFFGLSGSDTIFLPQPLLPIVDRRGKFLLTEPGSLALAPNGHGGILLEFLRPERREELDRAGIEHLFFFQVDNPLVRIADPVFIGYHIAHGAEVTSKAVPRRSATEPVGVFCRLGKTSAVVEYSELSDECLGRTEADGSLTFCHGNMANHIFSRRFLDRMVKDDVELPFHVRERAVACLGRRGRQVRPTDPNALEFRFFLFDSLRVATDSCVVLCSRDEFSPVRHPQGERSPLSAQCDLSRVWASWLERAGAEVPTDSAGHAKFAVEVSPLYALDEEELAGKIELPLTLDKDLYLGSRP